MPDDMNDFLNPDEIEALLNSASELPESALDPTPVIPPGGFSIGDTPNANREFLDPSDMDDLLQSRDAGGESLRPTLSSESVRDIRPDQTIERAQSHLNQAMAGSIQMPDPVAKFGNPSPLAWSTFESSQQRPSKARQPLDILQDVELDLRIELGRTEMLIEEVVALKEGSVVTLDKLAGDPVDILVNGRLIARGEVLVLNDNFCVRVAEILTPEG